MDNGKMGISISQPAPQVDRSYAPKIVGLVRLWGGYNILANELAQLGVSDDYIAGIMDSFYDGFIFDELACLYYPSGSAPLFYYDIKTGKAVQYFPVAPPHFVVMYSDLTRRYPGYQTYFTKKTTYSAQSGHLNAYDADFNTNVPLPFTQDDIDAMNKIFALASSSYPVDFDRAVSPMANYYVVGVMWGNANPSYEEYHVVFKTITETEPWA